MQKIKAKGTVVEVDGDEMTRTIFGKRASHPPVECGPVSVRML
jgi:hypothetical protein